MEDKKYNHLVEKADRHEKAIGRCEKAFLRNGKSIDKVLALAIENKNDISGILVRMDSIENIVNKTFNKIDDFLMKMNIYDAEIVANRAGINRLDERLTLVEGV